MENLLRIKLTPAGAIMAGFLVLASGVTPAAMGQNSQPDANPSASSTPAPTSTPPSSAESSAENNSQASSKKKSKKDSKNNPPPANTANNGSSPSGYSPEPTVQGVKPGSIDDVNAVGTRDIGGRGVGNWYSTESEIRMGKSYAAQLEKSVKFVNDPVVDEYVNRIGQNLVKNSDAKVPFTIKVIDSDEVNAMALPGGFFYVNSGLILAADTEAEMAGVMAHEIAHVAAHHAVREQTRMNYAQFGTIPLIFIGGWTGYGIYEAANLAIPVTFLQFSRDFEGQADFLGIQYMYRAGYDPEALVSMFEKLGNLEKTKPNVFAKAFSTHPQTPSRIEATQKEIATLLPPRQEYVVTTSEFDDVKARLARLENKRKLKNGEKNNQPTLRRANTTNNDPNDQNSQQGNDRPTLQRRDDN